MRKNTTLIEAALIFLFIFVLSLFTACAAKTPSGDTAGQGAAATPTAAGAAPAEPLHQVILLSKDCKGQSIYEKMDYINQNGGNIEIVFKSSAFIGKVPAKLLPEVKNWPEFFVLVDSTKDFDSLPIEPECKQDFAKMMPGWSQALEKAKNPAPAAPLVPGPPTSD